MLYEDITTVMVLIFYCLTVIFYFLYEIIQTKQVKKAFKHWKGLIWVAAFNVVVVVVVSMIHASVVSTKPEPQEIESVSLVKAVLRSRLRSILKMSVPTVTAVVRSPGPHRRHVRVVRVPVVLPTPSSPFSA